MQIGITRVDATASCVAERHLPAISRPSTPRAVRLRIGIVYARTLWESTQVPAGRWMSMWYPPMPTASSNCRPAMRSSAVST